MNKIIKKSKVLMYAVIIVFFSAIIIGVPKIFAELQPVKSIEIYSENLNYKNKEPGAWKIIKSAKWTKQGEAEITFDLDSILKTNNNLTDILFVLDISGSMIGEKLERVKKDTIELIESLLSNDKNRAGLITFDTESEILSDFTNDKNLLVEKINSLEDRKTTNYYQALVNVDTILKNYTKEENRECVVLFLTDGYPNKDTPNETGEYNYLKNQYPYININAIQYEMGDSIVESIKNISDNQFIADMDTLNNVLFAASVTPIAFNNFKITDYIDKNYFHVEDEKSIKTSQGKISYDKNTQRIEWILNNYRSGSKTTMTIKAKLKENVDTERIYSTNEKEEITSKIEETSEDITSKKTPVLADNYKVTYDGNAPEDCNMLNVPKTKNYSVLETVAISDEVPVCSGYQFKGWKITTKDVEMVNDDSFIMPESDVEIKGTWSKVDIKKSMNGTINESLTMYKQVQQDFKRSYLYIKKYTGDTSTFNGNEDVYYYYGYASNNNVIFANYCWKIVRTTDTGGVKLIYNGIPSEEGKCNNTGDDSQLTAEQMNLSTNNVAFNKQQTSLADVGYMYNDSTRYTYKNKKADLYTVVDTSTSLSSNYYYADSISYDNKYYSLNSPQQYSWADNYNNLVGKYTLMKSSSSSINDYAYYIVKAEANRMYYIKLKKGNDITSVGYEPTIIMSSSVNDNGDGTYTLINPTTINKEDWYTVYKQYNNYYTCGSNELTCNASDLKLIVYVGKSVMYSVSPSNVIKYGNSFEWDGKNYKLKDTIDIFNPFEANVLDNHHYTCFNTEGICQTISYIYYTDSLLGIYYIDISSGKSVETALNEMLYNDDVNKDSSDIKKAIDSWYYNNMTEYTSYLEDTVWCNNRSMSNQSTNGWNPNGGSTSTLLNFYPYSKSMDLICQNKNDRFTVSSENGNGALTYPVGLITYQEQLLNSITITSPLLTTGKEYGALSPLYFGKYGANYFTVGSDGAFSVAGIDDPLGVRPLISLRGDIEYSSGNGSKGLPYIIDAPPVSFNIIIDNSNVVSNIVTS